MEQGKDQELGTPKRSSMKKEAEDRTQTKKEDTKTYYFIFFVLNFTELYS